jgi:multimeric flavodoxin WrbA
MSKNVLSIGGSPRKDGNSELLCKEFARGAETAGNHVEYISLSGKKIGFCMACYACEKGCCPQKDDAFPIIEKMLAADVLVLATPVYFYTMSAQLKALIDRSVMVYPKIEKKDFYYIMTMADTDRNNFTGTIEALRGFAEYCEGSRECGAIVHTGFYQEGEVLETEAFKESYQMGLFIQ